MLTNRMVLSMAAGAVGAFVGETVGQTEGMVAGVVTALLLFVASRVFGGPPVLLEDSTVQYSCPLIDREEISHDVVRFRFGLPSPEHALGLPIGKHVYVHAKTASGGARRSYTPITSDEERGYFDLMLKIYFPAPPKFPDGGKMSQHLHGLKIGDTVDFQGPTGHVRYLGRGSFAIEETKGANKGQVKETRQARTLGMIAGGTGITPMLQVIRAILRDKDDTTTIHLLYANKTVDDILVRAEIEAAAALPERRFKYHYTLDEPPADWDFSKGFISEEMIREHMPAAGDDVQVLMCGPPPMIKFACKPNLEKVGYTAANYIDY